MAGTLPGLRELPSRRRALLMAAGVAALGYAGYRAYHSDTVTAWRRALKRLTQLLDSTADTLNSGAELTGSLVDDMRAYLDSDQPDLPPRLRQLVQLAQQEEVTSATSHTVAALLAGLQQGAGGQTKGADAPAGPDALDRVLSALLSERGQSLVGLAVALGARNLVEGFYGAWAAAGAKDAPEDGKQEGDVLDRLLGWLGTARGQRAARRMLASAAGSGVGVYCDKTADVNVFDQMLSALSARREHLGVAKVFLTVLVREAVRAATGERDGAATPLSLSPSSSAASLAAEPVRGSLQTLRRLASLQAEGKGDAGTPAERSEGGARKTASGGIARQVTDDDAQVKNGSSRESVAPKTPGGWAATLGSCVLAAAGAAADVLCQRTVAVFLAVAFVILLLLQISARLVSALLF
ncbi:hypothetical protein QBZ16_001686 [Prototheca wickerhamii]|uniref:Protein PHLOEM PROTEIN 2-LIKE A10 n=1 Tax=Prototheca wickerhamii TaxID=3111 RepID=A0AAD9ID53_PROWI|nr:hypothetical protein QBZ16_001686 [Prototheca wickerhamii]